ncbi:hypothetical protein COEX109129_39365 [Corallococcus exiguus]
MKGDIACACPNAFNFSYRARGSRDSRLAPRKLCTEGRGLSVGSSSTGVTSASCSRHHLS